MKIFDGLHAYLWQDYRENNCNTYLIDGVTKVLVDPGHRHLFSHVQEVLVAAGLSPEQIDVVAITHGHRDHIGAASEFSQPTRLAMNPEEYEFSRKRFRPEFSIPPPDYPLEEGAFTAGEHQFQVILAPGHSPASVCLYWPEKKALFTGDVIFRESVGRVDLPGGNGAQLKESLMKLEDLEVEYLLPGHGEPVMGKDDIKDNFRFIRDHVFGYL
jgi:glyoxylase-like metal-dependent hydrolase (beta-lactamase superfamily II)